MLMLAAFFYEIILLALRMYSANYLAQLLGSYFEKDSE